MINLFGSSFDNLIYNYYKCKFHKNKKIYDKIIMKHTFIKLTKTIWSEYI